MPLRRLAYAAALLLPLAACGAGKEEAVRVSIIDDAANPGSQDAAQLYLRADTAQGLVRLDETGNILPGLAESWIVVDEGRSYIFRLRTSNWENGDAVTTEQVAQILSDRMRRGAGDRLARDVGELRDVRAMTQRVIEVRLSAPKPDLLRILAQPEFAIDRGNDGTGPLSAEWQDNRFRLQERVQSLDAEEDRNNAYLIVRGEPAAEAIARYDLDLADLVLGGRFQHLPLLSATDIPVAHLRFDRVKGLFGLLFVENKGFLAAPANREALAKAINRGNLFDGPAFDAWQPETRLVPYEGGIAPDMQRWQELGIPERRAQARLTIVNWEQANGPAPVLRIAMPEGAGARILFSHIASDLSLIGVRARRVGMRQDADLRLIDQVAAYDKATWYLNQLSCALRPVCNEEGDVLLARAKRAVDPDVRARWLGEAEVLMTNANTFIPLGMPLRWSLAPDNRPGFAPNTTGWHPLSPLIADPR